MKFVDPLGLDACCDCPGGVWDQDQGDFGFSLAAGGYGSIGHQNLTCRSKKKLRCKTRQICVGGGLVWGGGGNWNLIGEVTGANSCASLGGKWSDTQVSGSGGPGGMANGQGEIGSGAGGSSGVGLGLGGGIALITCYTTVLSCNDK